MLGATIMSYGVQAVFYLLAVICFVLYALCSHPRAAIRPWGAFLLGLGLALFAFPLMWNAFALS